VSATYAHDEKGLTGLCRMLMRMEVSLVAIERPDGLLVERLLDPGLRVLALHPNKVAAARDRFRVGGGKSDRFDAFVLCELARTDNHRFRVLEPDCDRTKAIRAMTRAQEGFVATRTGIVNQLRAELERFGPGRCCCSVTWTPRSRFRSLSAIPARWTPAALESHGCRRLSSARGIRVGSTRPR
jgi:hypothetical protein